MADKKMTIREGFENARALYAELGNAEMVEFFDGRIAKLARKTSTTTRKPTKKQIENASFKEQIASWMDANTAYTSAEVFEKCPCADVSKSKVAALLSQMGKEGVLNVSEGKNHIKVYTLA